MRAIKETLETWPRRANGEPIFRTSNDAVFFAQLAHSEQHVIDDMKAWREKAYRHLKNLRKRIPPDLDIIFEYAVKAQFFRECFMEILRIQDEEK